MVRMAPRGELEQRVMELLWAAQQPRTVAELHAELLAQRSLAYTTVMTVLDRLAKKGMTNRRLVNRAWRYEPAEPQHIVVAREMHQHLVGLAPEMRDKVLARFQQLLDG